MAIGIQSVHGVDFAGLGMADLGESAGKNWYHGKMAQFGASSDCACAGCKDCIGCGGPQSRNSLGEAPGKNWYHNRMAQFGEAKEKNWYHGRMSQFGESPNKNWYHGRMAQFGNYVKDGVYTDGRDTRYARAVPLSYDYAMHGVPQLKGWLGKFAGIGDGEAVDAGAPGDDRALTTAAQFYDLPSRPPDFTSPPLVSATTGLVVGAPIEPSPGLRGVDVALGVGGAAMLAMGNRKIGAVLLGGMLADIIARKASPQYDARMAAVPILGLKVA